MASPYEIVAAPLELYVAPIATPFPLINVAPAVAWVKVGASGTRNYSDDGVSVTHEQEISDFTPAGATVPRKVWRTGESMAIAVELADVTVEQYAKALNDAIVTTTVAAAGVAGQKSMALFRGDQVKTFALLCRGLSPVNEAMFSQYEVLIVYQGADSIELTYNKGEPAMLSLEFTALSDDTGNFGTYRTGVAPPL